MKKYLPILLCIVLPVIAFVITILAGRPNFDFNNWDAVLILSLIFVVIMILELVLTFVYIHISRKIQTSHEIKQEERIERLGRFYEETKGKKDDDDYIDPVMEDIIKRKKFALMTRSEIIDYCKKLNHSVMTEVTIRQQDDLPDIISAGDKSYCLLYEKLGIIKLTIKNRSFYIDKIKAIHPNITQAGKVSDWYEIILDETFSDNDQVKDLLKTAYEYVISANFLFINGAYIVNEAIPFVNEEELIVPVEETDENFKTILEKKQKLSELTLTSRDAIADFAEKNIKGDYTAYVIKRKGFAVYSLKAFNRSYGLLYERESVVKMWLRFDTDFAKLKMQEHPTLMRAKFPKGKDWYSIILDNSFDEDYKISELIWTSYYYVCNEYLIKKGVSKNIQNT